MRNKKPHKFAFNSGLAGWPKRQPVPKMKPAKKKIFHRKVLG